MFNINSTIDGNVAKLTLGGRLDANAVPQFRKEIEKITNKRPTIIAYFLNGLETIADEGARVIANTQQTIRGVTDVYVVGARDQVVNTLETNGAGNSVNFVEEFEPAGVAG